MIRFLVLCSWFVLVIMRAGLLKRKDETTNCGGVKQSTIIMSGCFFFENHEWMDRAAGPQIVPDEARCTGQAFVAVWASAHGGLFDELQGILGPTYQSHTRCFMNFDFQRN
jgi:hypothetical protein